MKVLLLTGMLILATSTLAFADQNCSERASQPEINDCVEKAFQKSDDELNKLYKQIETRLTEDADKNKLLVNAQKAWISFRDAECNFSSSGVIGGTIYPTIVSTCLDRMTQRRIRDFRGYLKCAEGDLDCPVPAAD